MTLKRNEDNRDNVVGVLLWPSQSPDKDPIQHLWWDLNMAFLQLFSSNLTELERIWRKERQKILKSTCAMLVALCQRFSNWGKGWNFKITLFYFWTNWFVWPCRTCWSSNLCTVTQFLIPGSTSGRVNCWKKLEDDWITITWMKEKLRGHMLYAFPNTSIISSDVQPIGGHWGIILPDEKGGGVNYVNFTY